MSLGIGLVSPGISLKEIDLTKGSVLVENQFIGAIAGPFPKGPVEEAVLVRNENEFIEIFGKPVTTDDQSDYYHVAESYLAYGGVLKVIRCTDNTLNTANVGVGSTSSITLNIKNYDDYLENHSNSISWEWASKTPGTWANNLKVCVIDDLADQIISGISTTTTITTTFVGVTTVSDGDIGITTTSITGITTAGINIGDDLKITTGIIGSGTTVTAIGVGTVYISPATLNTISLDNVQVSFGDYVNTTSGANLTVGSAVTCKLSGSRVNVGSGTTSSWNTDTILEGTLTQIGSGSISVKWNTYSTVAGVSTFFQYSSGRNYEVKTTDGNIFVGVNNLGSPSTTTIVDWYNQQTLDISSDTVFWRSLAPKPVSSSYARSRRSWNDSLHVVVVDEKGTATGIVGNIVEKFVSLSKAKDATLSAKSLYYKESLALNSKYVYAGYAQTGLVSKSGSPAGNGVWGLEATGSINYNVIGNKTFTLVGGANYSGGGYQATLESLVDAYNVVANKEEEDVNFLIYGPSLPTKEQSQAKANKLLEIAENRKDCIVTISPYKDDVVGTTNSDTQTSNIVSFFNGIDSSSYGVFDSGYKYIFDRFTNKYKYIPCNGDIAGLMVRTTIENHSWYSPAGSERGTLRNAIKLAYNPNQIQRDQLYINRVNPIIYSPGSGIILFGDKTAQTFVSAFDRINVRRLFLEIEDVISNISKNYLFEFNDEFTRTSFVSQVDPYLRDIEAKRGIDEYVVVCDDTNNTPDVIDRNEFVAEIYVKPARSINFIGLTFVATRTGINFEEVIGRF